MNNKTRRSDSVTNRSFCDGVTRRSAIQIGAASFAGSLFTLPGLLERTSHGASASTKKPDEVSLIIVFLRGGLSTIDTVDMKPNAPADVRGEFHPIETNVAGTTVCEHLPKTARQMDKIALVRSFSHFDANHATADHYVLTGYPVRPGFNPSLKPNNQHPSLGSAISRKLGPRGSVPPYVCLPQMHPSGSSAFLGPGAAPFVVNADPNSPNFTVPDLMPPLTIDADRLQSRTELRNEVDRFQASAEIRANRSARTLTTFQQKAFDLMTSSQAKAAFDIDRESASLRDEYGRTSLGQCCLMARRLVEAGVRCVTIDHTNWDTHYALYPVLKNDLLPQLDGAMPALFRDLADRGLLESTLVLVTGEFGRTPRINNRAGRDHWSAVSTLILGGGGIQGGRVIGASN
ncbi:DUF1501 domain-containing protein, partial [Candidatus Woesearchaeota archaeon]|nr:DUF1501 domain-containing protein [Candidatus Woesearchaeota archaeon]